MAALGEVVACGQNNSIVIAPSHIGPIRPGSHVLVLPGKVLRNEVEENLQLDGGYDLLVIEIALHCRLFRRLQERVGQFNDEPFLLSQILAVEFCIQFLSFLFFSLNSSGHRPPRPDI